MRPKRCEVYIPYDGHNATIGAAGTVDVGVHDGAPVQQEMGSTGLVALLLDTAADMVNMFSMVPRDVNWTKEIGVRVLYQTASDDSADTIDWIVLYDVLSEEDAMITGTTALDTTVAQDTVTGTAQVLELSPRGVIDGNTLTPAQIAGPSFFTWNVEMDAFAVGLDQDKFFLGLLIDYMPKVALGGPSTFDAAHDQENM